jgi:hypothetical protein
VRRESGSSFILKLCEFIQKAPEGKARVPLPVILSEANLRTESKRLGGFHSEFVDFFADRDRFEGWELDDGGKAEVR